VIDRASACPVVIASAAGGMDIEEVAASHPDKILREYIDPGTGLVPFQARKLAFGMGLEAGPAQKLVKVLDAIYRAFIDTDASMIEINPLILTKGGDLLALDAKVSFDDNALYRHQDLRDLRDLTEEDPLEVEAAKFSLNYSRGRTRQLPGRRRRRQCRADPERIQDPDVGPECEGGPDQHLRRDPAV
jgi:succinyl-CoA synthetase beta subunit